MELVMVGLIIPLLVGGVWGIYFMVVNTFYEEQQVTLIQAEGELILNLIQNGGYFKGRRVYGLNSAYPGSIDIDNRPPASATFDGDSDDYTIEFALDETATNRRYAEFSIEFNGNTSPTSKLWFRLRVPSMSGNSDENYDVLITENLLQRKKGTNPTKFGDYEKTWFKAQLLPEVSGSDYDSGIKVSFYLVDITRQEVYPLEYNYRLDRKLLDTQIGASGCQKAAGQKSSFLGAYPYPKYFSTIIYFPNRED